MFNAIANLVDEYGVLGVALLMLVENLVPIIPSELILPFAGFEIARGQMGAPEALIAATIASTAGALPWYVLGRRLGLPRTIGWIERYGAWTTLSPADIKRGCGWFARWGGWAVLVGRAMPGVRSFIPVPAGIAGMGLGAFLGFATIGAGVWSALLMGLGFLLQEHYAAVKHWLDPVLDGLLGLVALTYLVRLSSAWRRRPTQQDEGQKL